jgi:uncharacterized membrane protein
LGNNTKPQQKTASKIPEKKSVIITVLLSIITLGIYCPLWFIKRTPELNNLQTKTKSKKTLATFLLILHLLLIGSIIGLFVDAQIESVDLTAQLDSVPLTFTILSFTAMTIILIEALLFLLLSFKTRKILNEALINKGVKRKVSGFFTFFLNYYYLQYEINRIVNDKETKKRIGPWLSLIFVYLILPIISGAIQQLI